MAHNTQSALPPTNGDAKQPQNFTVGPPPFNNPSADLILRSHNQTDFHVWRDILREASPIFSDMFTVAQPRSDQRPTTDIDAPVVHVTESARTLESLLRYCYPTPDPDFSSIDDLKPVLEAAQKYQIAYIVRALAQQLLVFADGAPLQAFSVALQFDLVDTARAAAKLTLRYEDPCPFTKELEFVSAAAYHHLLSYRRECARVACGVVGNLGWVTSLPDAKDCVWFVRVSTIDRPQNCSCKLSNHEYSVSSYTQYRSYATSWFLLHLERVAKKLSIMPCRGVVVDPSLSDQMVLDAVACSHCRQHILAQSRLLHTRIAAEIDKRISCVKLQIVRKY
ncbi:hypothetical protein BC628DRAFT_1395332 [Trametes gibbosa]|nr:hypothetical protein BC628DRAFT_1395332 [Trametes gibbosa]